MKNLFFIVLLISSFTYAQNNSPELEMEGKQVKATYFYDNGAVQQVGHFLDGKLEGKWISFDQTGAILSEAQYSYGMKTGKWILYAQTIPVKEIDYVLNQIISVRETTTTALASKN
jgi:antitoxin component YwqK of YwqJK toxin-antitoxin module